MLEKNSEEWKEINQLYQVIKEADSIIIGAGSGLSTSAGFEYHGERFQKYFSDFIEKYHFRDMYSAGFYPYSTFEEYWGYWSRYIYINRYVKAPKPVYDELFSLVKDKNYFVITTNVDHQFQKAGFDKNRLFYTQGDYGLFQCSEPCSFVTYDNEEIVYHMVKEQRNGKIPTFLIPHCPICGKPMSMNLRVDDTFVEDEGWHLAAKRYTDFLYHNEKKKVLFLDLGTGNNTPMIIKYPFFRMTREFSKATYASINLGESYAPKEIQHRSLCINDDIGFVLNELKNLN